MAQPAPDTSLYGALLGDAEIETLFSAEADLAQMVMFESALAVAEGAESVIPRDAAATIADRLQSFAPDLAALRPAAARDGVVVPDLVRQMRAHVGAEADNYVHFGATSQDAIDTSLALRLASVTRILEARIGALAATLDDLAERFGGRPLMGRTRMQAALPITAGDRIAGWRTPLATHITRLAELQPRLLILQFGGPVGTLGELGSKGPAVAQRLARTLGLGLPARSWHTRRDGLAEFASWLSLVSGSLGKIGADIGLMAQMGEIELAVAGGSSAMPHKRNPVKAEVLVALARHNATLLPAMHQALVAEQERSGAAWTLEWLTLPQMAVATGAGLRTAIELAGSITGMGTSDG